MSGRPQPPEKIPGHPTLHGAYSRPTRSRRVRRARRRFLALLTEGYPAPATREQAMLSVTADAMVRLNEVNAYLDAHGGLVDSNGQPHGVVKVYVSLINAVRRNLEVLGLRADLADKAPSIRCPHCGGGFTELRDYTAHDCPTRQAAPATALAAAMLAGNGSTKGDAPADDGEAQDGSADADNGRDAADTQAGEGDAADGDEDDGQPPWTTTGDA